MTFTEALRIVRVLQPLADEWKLRALALILVREVESLGGDE